MAVQLRYESSGVRVVDTYDNTGTYFDLGFFPFTAGGSVAAEQAAIYHATVNKGLAPASITPKLGASSPPHVNTAGGSGNIGASTSISGKSTDSKH